MSSQPSESDDDVFAADADGSLGPLVDDESHVFVSDSPIEPSAAAAAPPLAASSPPPPVAAQPPVFPYAVRMHGARISYEFDASRAFASIADENGDLVDFDGFESDPKTHGTEDEPTAFAQAVNWAKAKLKQRQEAEAAEQKARRDELLVERRNKGTN